MTDGREWFGTGMIAASSLAYASAGYFTRLIPVDIWTMLFWRGVSAGVFIAIVAAWLDRGIPLARRFRLGRAGLAVALLSAAATICFLSALRLSSVAEVMIISATAPFVAAVLQWAWTGERPRWPTLAASVAALAGVLIAVGGSRLSGELAGHALAAGMTITFAAMMVVIRRHREVSMLPAASVSAFLCAAAVAPIAAPLTVSTPELLLLMIFGTVQFGLGLLLLTLGTRHVSATRAALISSLDVPLAVAIVWATFGERPSIEALIGGAIVLGAVAVDVALAARAANGRVGR